MSKKKQGSRRFRRIKWTLAVAVFYIAGSIGYYVLPWSVRKPIYTSSPELDRALRKNGLAILEGWDNLGLWGSDCSIPMESQFRAAHAYGGFPSQGFKLVGRLNVLENEGFTVGYSESLRNPLWVAYRVFDVPQLVSEKRPSRFKVDDRTSSKVSHDDYTHSGYDRGHMAPNYAISTRFGSDGQKETFLMSNIIPQNPMVNQHLWKDLEHRVALRYGRYFSEVWVMTGPVFREPIKKLKSGVAIPAAYYKIIADENEGRLRVIAFLVEEEPPPYSRLASFLVSIDRLEEETGLDFFPDLPEEQQQELESRPAGRLWPYYLPAVRYRFGGKTQ